MAGRTGAWDGRAARYQAWFDKGRRLRPLITELEELSLRAAADTEGRPQPSDTPQ